MDLDSQLEKINKDACFICGETYRNFRKLTSSKEVFIVCPAGHIEIFLSGDIHSSYIHFNQYIYRYFHPIKWIHIGYIYTYCNSIHNKNLQVRLEFPWLKEIPTNLQGVDALFDRIEKILYLQ